jgi:hypothetical protein
MTLTSCWNIYLIIRRSRIKIQSKLPGHLEKDDFSTKVNNLIKLTYISTAMLSLDEIESAVS